MIIGAYGYWRVRRWRFFNLSFVGAALLSPEIAMLHLHQMTASLTHYRPAMPFGNVNIYFRFFFVQYCHNLKNVTPLET